MEHMHIFIGLGNPGASYAHNRHNSGFMALDALIEGVGGEFSPDKIYQAKIWKGAIAGVSVIAAKPETFMNHSGETAAKLTREFPDAMLAVMYDDIDIPLGTVKCSFGRGGGGHNGLQSIIDHLGHPHFFRVRIGVRPIHEALLPRIAPPDGFEKFLLDDFTPMEQDGLKEGIEKSVRALTFRLTHSPEETMNEYN